MALFQGKTFELIGFDQERGTSYSGLQADRSGSIWAHNCTGQLIHTIRDIIEVEIGQKKRQES